MHSKKNHFNITPTTSKENEQLLAFFYTSKKTFIAQCKRYCSQSSRAKDFYFHIIKKLKDAILTNKLDDFERFCDVIEYVSIKGILTHTYQRDPKNPLIGTNLVILACKFNRPEILKLLFGKCCKTLNILCAAEVLSLDYADEESHNSLYYAISSNNIDLLGIFFDQYPGTTFTPDLGKFDEIFSQAYDELKLKRVPLTFEMEFFVENKLLGRRFFSENSNQVEHAENELDNIMKRIELVVENVFLLNAEYSHADVDEKFLIIAKFITRNIHLLKRQLKSTYRRLPWEEIEFCLICFVSSHEKQQDINLLYCLNLSKSKVLNYLAHFAQKLKDESLAMEHTNVYELAKLPNLKRDQVIQEIIEISPEFEELYTDYKKVRDFVSIEKIHYYLSLAVSANPEVREGHLTIARTLQVMGEYFKNSLESPKLSNTVSELLLSGLSQKTRKVIIDLRNALSHSYSLAKRTEIEEKGDSGFFSGIQNDMKIIGTEVFDFLHYSRMECMELFLKKVSAAKCKDDLQEVLKTCNSKNLYQVFQQDPETRKFENLKKLMEELRRYVTDPTSYEKKWFKDIEELSASTSAQSEDVMSGHLMKFSALIRTLIILKNEEVNSNLFCMIKRFSNAILKRFDVKMEPRVLKAVNRIFEISRSVKSRVNQKQLEEICRLEYKLYYQVVIARNDVKWIEKFREQLNGKDSMFLADIQEFETTKLNYSDRLTSKISELRSILSSYGCFKGEMIERPTLMKLKQLQPMIEMLVLDVMSILGNSKKCLENNSFFLDYNVPLLIGKCLRDHLAHHNAVLDLLSYDPYLAVILNAKKLVSVENLIDCSKKIGKFMKDNPFTLSTKHNQELDIITNQEKMFSALVEGNLELLKNCLGKGSDIRARSNNLSTAVHFACMSSNLEILQFTLNQNLSPNARNADGQTALHVAAAHGSHNIVHFLLKEAGLKVNDIDYFRSTPLHLAAKSGHLNTVQVLLRNNASTVDKDARGFSPFHLAVRNKHISVVKILLKKDRNFDSNEAFNGCTSLHYAAGSGSLDLVNFLLLNKANVNARDDAGEAPIHLAVILCYLNITRVLIQHGANVNFRNIYGFTPLHIAVINEHESIVRILLKHGANPNVYEKEKGFVPLHYAAQQDSNGILSALLEYGGNANMPTLTGETALLLAAQSAPLEIVAILLKHGVDVQATNNKKDTALHYASRRGHKEIAELLLRSGIDVNSKNDIGKTPLHAAAASGHPDLVKLLIKYKAAVNTQCAAGTTPLHIAAQSENISVIDVLLKNKTDVNIKDSHGLTAIHVAVQCGCENTVNLLLSKKADIYIKANNDTSPFQTAILASHLSIVKYILNSIQVKNTAAFFEDTFALRIAVQAGNKEIAKFLIVNGADVNLKIDSLTPLAIAVKLNRLEMVELLLANGANVNENNGAPLRFAIQGGFKDIFETLLKNGADTNKVSTENVTALHLAAIKGDERMVTGLINKGAKVDAISQGVTPLLLASKSGHVEVVRALITKKANVNIGNIAGTPLHAAVDGGHHEVVQILLNNGAKSNVKGFQNKTLLEVAVNRGELKIAEMLLKQTEIDVNFRGEHGQTLLHHAALQSNVELVKLLADHGFDMNSVDDSGVKPIHAGAATKRKETVEYFLSKGISIHEINSVGQTPLHYAAANGSIEVVNYLIACGANINFEDVDGLRPIHVAARNGHREIIKILLKNGTSYYAIDKFNKKPLQYSSNEGVKSLLISIEKLFHSLKEKNLPEVSNLIKAGAFIDAKHSKFGTPLHYAVWKGYDNIVDVLLENHANPNVVSEKGYTPLHYAAKYSRFKSVISLLHQGAVYNLAPNGLQTPLYFSKDDRITWLLKMIDQAFKNVKKGNTRVTNDLRKLTDKEIVKAIMRACNEENHTLVVAAIHRKYSQVKQLKQIFQGNASIDAAEMIYYSQNGSFQSQNILESLLENRKDILGEDNPGTLDVHVCIAELKCKQRHYKEAMNILNNVNKKQIEMLGSSSDDTLYSKALIGTALVGLEKFEEAFNIYEELYHTRKEISGPDHADTLEALGGMASALGSLGKIDEAFSNFETIFELRKKLFGEYHLLTLASRSNMAAALSNQGKFEEGLKIYQEVLAKMKIIEPNHPATLEILQIIGKIFTNQKKHHDALNIFEEVFNIQKDMLGPNHPNTLRSQALIAAAFRAQFRYHTALKVYKEVLKRSKALYGLDHPDVMTISKSIDDINLQLKVESFSVTESLHHLPEDIFVAASEGDLETIQQILKAKAAVNDTDIDGRSPLHYSVNNGHFNVVKFLLKNGADPALTTNKGNTSLHTAVAKGDITIIKVLFEHVAEDKIRNFINLQTTAGGTSALHIAARNGFLNVVKFLLNHGAKYNIKNEENKTPLDVSTNQNVVAFLRVMEGLFEGAAKGTPEIISKLKAMDLNDFKVVTNARNQLESTLFQVALAKKHKYIVSQLLAMYCSIAVQCSSASS